MTTHKEILLYSEHFNTTTDASVQTNARKKTQTAFALH